MPNHLLPNEPGWVCPEMAEFAAAYVGTERLFVRVAHDAADEQAFVSVWGINHPYNNKIFRLKISYVTGINGHIAYLDESKETAKKGEEQVFLRIEEALTEDGFIGTLFLPNYRGYERYGMALNYSLKDSEETFPRSLLKSYARQFGKDIDADD